MRTTEPRVHQSSAPDRLTIVIPALNEEEAIAATISRCLAARDEIAAAAGLEAVEIIVVSDGSTDRTAEIAASFDEVQTVVFEENRGYGAAIKEGWRLGSGTLVGFLDADGTCDPRYFAEMCSRAVREHAAVVLGSRLGPDSQMPRVRRVGNRIYAFLLGLLCGRHVTDTASGMRVVRRSALEELYPLPDGLHFTPSMSARALLNDLKVIEIPMRYEERIGTSKLSVFRDGIRFLQTIFAGVLCYRPEKILLGIFLACVLGIVVIGLTPTEYYFHMGALEDWMIYRFVACAVLASFSLTLLLATAVAHQMSVFGPRQPEASFFWPSIIGALFRAEVVASLIVLLGGTSVWFAWPGVVQFWHTGMVTDDVLHWSWLLAATFGVLAMAQVSVFALLSAMVKTWRAERASGVPSRTATAGAPSSSDPRSRTSLAAAG